LDGDCLGGRELYDYIFCRNLLIYFDRPTQQKVLQKLDHLLKPSGVLFVGPVELPLVASQGFASARIPMAAACRKADVQDKSKVQSPKSKMGRQTLAFGLGTSDARLAGRPKKPTSKAAAPGTRAEVQDKSKIQNPKWKVGRQSLDFGDGNSDARLAEAARLADEGRLAEAAQICQNYVRAQGACAQAFYLLGLIRDAEGHDAQALNYYRKALYLEPDHYETLVQMATLSGKKGDTNGARLLHRRAQRILKKLNP
jgi:chemotaxis protein methyltransferase WspC